MKRAGGIAGLSIPFAAGVAACSFPNMSFTLAAGVSALSLTALSALVLHLLRRGGGYLPYMAAYLLLGLFCASSHRLCLPFPPGCISRFAASCLSSLQDIITSMPFGNEDTPSLLVALLTGDRSGLKPSTVAMFRSSGASHLLALSGLHLGVIYMVVSRLFSLLGGSPAVARARFGVVCLLSSFYALMTGLGPSIVRALLFILIGETCRLDPERSRSATRTLAAALTMQLAFSPGQITSVGFQLSYLAMCGIVLVHPHLDAWYPGGSSPLRRVWSLVSMTISCQLFTAPLSYAVFHNFPRWFLLTNLLALPLTSLLMMSAVCGVALSAAGICPQLLLKAVDALSGALLSVLEIISGM